MGSKKRNPKSKRLHDASSGKFISEDKIDSLTPFGYNKETSFWENLKIWK
jgi:hypothetical protein